MTEKKQAELIDSVEEFEFEPIKGYPMLNWRGKRPFRSTLFYPAQLKETHGDPTDGWYNRIYWGDNLQVMSHLLKDFRGKIDLVYIDPPFDSKADYKKKVELKGLKANNDQSAFEEKQYADIWSNDEYLQFMYERIVLVKELLSDNGAIFLHADWHKSHHLRCILDEVFGPDNFCNEIIWCYTGASQTKSRFPRKHDNIFYYRKGENPKFNWQDIVIPYSEETVARTGRGAGESGLYGDNDAQDKHKNRLHKGGKVPEDWWVDIHRLQGNGLEKENYPTQKPEALVERIIRACTNEKDIVFDCFMGSGTLQAAALKAGRRYIGADINLGATQTTTKRLLNISSQLQNKELNLADNPEKFFFGFQVYNVNHYDVFRNPVQAKDLLREALEIQPLDRNTIFDGEKDGRMVKIMPVNRIATRADLNELITNFDYKLFEKRQGERPNQPVERITLVCMGHEPDLAAILQHEVGYKLDVEVVDILRDRGDLQFKRDAEATVVVENGTLKIEAFYPLNLLQKLSYMKENVQEWRELVESVMIDWNYNGSVFEPELVDIPEKNALVKGEYPIPANAKNIRIKITDLLSESLEMGVANGSK